MGLPIAELIAGLFKPAAELIDNLHTSEEERLKQQAAQLEVQLAVALQFVEYEAKIAAQKASIVQAEVAGSGIKAWWRPITMLTFLVLAVADAFGVVTWASGKPLADEAWTLLQLGLGGYVVGRSAEKIVPSLTQGLVRGSG